MTLSKEELELLKQLNKKIEESEKDGPIQLPKNYIFKITAAHIVRKATITATSKSEAEEIMFEKYGDLPYELIEVQ